MTYFTYHQVLPAFLDFLLPFGEQQYPHDSCFHDFRHDSRLNTLSRGIEIPELGRSGHDLRFCYSLKSVERSDAQRWPWSVRQASIYHSFDLQSGATNWAIIKGDDLLQERMSKLSNSSTYQKLGPSSSACDLLAATFQAHLLLCDWAAESWRWYLNYLEERFQQDTRASYSILLDDLPATEFQSRRSTFQALPGHEGHTPVPSHGGTPRASVITPLQQPLSSGPQSGRPNVGNPTNGPQNPPGANPRAPRPQPKVTDFFKFEDLRTLQFIEEKTIEALLVLESNASIITRMREYYESVTQSSDWPIALKQGCKQDFARFQSELIRAERDMTLHQQRAKTLLRILENRKSMVSLSQIHVSAKVIPDQLYGILEYENIKASKQSTTQAQNSANKMEDLTDEMARVAFKTAKQTALMTLIAFVTIVYLPATFISTIWSYRHRAMESRGRPVDNAVSMARIEGISCGIFANDPGHSTYLLVGLSHLGS